MALKEKIVSALSKALNVEFIRLEEDDGISGFIVSSQFEGMSTLDRQAFIDKALEDGPDALTPKEKRQVLMIAALTPREYESAGARIRVDRVKQMAGGAVEIVLHGGVSDAEYVRGALRNQKGVQTTEPKSKPGAVGVLMYFRVKGNGAEPLTRDRVVQILRSDRYIEVSPNA